jgi:hypothetical protein
MRSQCEGADDHDDIVSSCSCLIVVIYIVQWEKEQDELCSQLGELVLAALMQQSVCKG